MSFIAVNYGYKNYSLFNTHCDTSCLIDNIKKVCIEELTSISKKRCDDLLKMIIDTGNEEEILKKKIKQLEIDKSKQEELIQEIEKKISMEEIANSSSTVPAKGAKPKEIPKKGLLIK
jgi:hypothetical protein